MKYTSEKELRGYWETCNPVMAHITSERSFHPWSTYRDQIVKGFNFADLDDFADSRILDYGIGSATLGKHLIEQCDIAHYTGIDISQRTLDVAQETLSEHRDKIHLVLLPVDNFAQFDPDYIFSMAVIQHFTTLEVYSTFLDYCNRSGAQQLFLQYRYADSLSFNGDDVIFGCRTNSNELCKVLTNYKLAHKGNVHPQNDYQYTRWKLNR